MEDDTIDQDNSTTFVLPPPLSSFCPHCGAPRPFDRIASALLDRLISIEDAIQELRAHVEEVTL